MPQHQPPAAQPRPREITIHGDTRVDEFHWLRNRDDPEVMAYLEAENAYTEAMTGNIKQLEERLYREFVGRIQETDTSVPVRIDDWWYYLRTEAGLDYPIHCRRHGDPEQSEEEIVLDVNRLAEGHEYYDLGVLEISPDHRLLAYSEDTDGSEHFTLRILDLTTGQPLGDAIPGTYASAVWAEDGRTLFYTVLDEARRPYQVFRHVLGSRPEDDVLVYHETDDAFFVDLDKTRDRRYLLIELGSNITSETRWLEADHPEGEFRTLLPRERGVEYEVDHRDGRIYVLTNRDAVNFRLLRGPAAAVERRGAAALDEELIAHDPRVMLEGIDLFQGHMAVYRREDGIRGIRVVDLESGGSHDVDFDEPVYVAGPGDNPEFASRTLRLVYSSPVTPRSVYDYDMDRQTLTLKKRTPVLGGYDPARYETRRIHAAAPDGEQVPVTVVHRREMPLNGDNPCLLYGYGAYGITEEPAFSMTRVSLLERGFVFAIAHIRGGGALGEPWKNAGKLRQKPNTFDDFIAAAETLIEQRYTQSERLAILGGSAGGMLIGAVVNMRPELFHAAVAQVPFVDVLNTMLDPSLPLTVIEYDEWGDPRERDYYELIKSYAPYENVRAQRYPHMLVVAGLNDPRVQYWEPAKWVARLRRSRTDDNLLLLRTHMGAGHKGASGRYEALREVAFDYAFVLDRLGIAE